MYELLKNILKVNFQYLCYQRKHQLELSRCEDRSHDGSLSLPGISFQQNEGLFEDPVPFVLDVAAETQVSPISEVIEVLDEDSFSQLEVIDDQAAMLSNASLLAIYTEHFLYNK